MTFAAVFTGPWGWLKSAAFEIGSLPWAGYALGYLSLSLILLPAIFLITVWIEQKFIGSKLSLRRAITTQAQVLLPLGLMAWIAFTVSFAFPKLNLILAVLNDPFGWGWHLLGMFDTSQMVSVAGVSSPIQVVLVLIGLFWSTRVSQKLSAGSGKHIPRSNIPILVFCLIFTLLMLWLLVG